MSQHERNSFIGGLTRQFDPTKIAENEYPLLINGRSRNDQIETILLPQELTEGLPPISNFQGLYSAGYFLIAFFDGLAYYRSFNPESPSSQFQPILDFSLDVDADRVYLELVPGSSVNFKRQLITASKPSSGVDLTSVIRGSPDCAIVTDGINQPLIIFPDASTRVSKNWAQWSDLADDDGANREYVPIGTYPMFHDGILYMAGKDTVSDRFNKLFRSVTGRPLDFMVAVDSSGNKLSVQSEGDANVMAHKVDYNSITSINRINAVEGSFFVGTSYNSYLVTPNQEKLIYGEPTFKNRWLFPTGPLNPFCVVDALGDTLIIDSKGIISFNAVIAAQNEGRSLPFSRKIHPLFDGITQTVACTAKMENYIYFGVNTVYGPAILVYDEVLDKWASVDIYPGVNLVKQFAVISTTTVKRLFFITIDNKLYEAFASPTTATCRLYSGEWMEKGKLITASASFKDILIAGQVHASLFTDSRKVNRLIQPVNITKTASTQPLEIPFGSSEENTNLDLTFNFENSPVGKKHGVLLEWNCKGILGSIKVDVANNTPKVDYQQESLIQSNGTDLINPDKLAIVGWAGTAGTTLASLVSQMKDGEYDKYVLLGNSNLPAGAEATLDANVVNYWDALKVQDKVIGVLGNKDLDTLDGKAHLQYFRQGYRYFNKVLSSYTELFILNSGTNTAGEIVEPDGITPTEKQGQWLKNRLERSFRKWKIVLLWDNPLYNTTWDWPFQEWGATLVICAKNRNYERLYSSENFSYINIGSGSTSGFDAISYPYLDESKYRDNVNNGFLEIEADAINLVGKFVKYSSTSARTVLDTFQILG
jgi:hypothetical protein